MPEPLTYRYDAAPAISQGRRDQQEDSVAMDFSEGSGLGFIVLADGMGGHAAGDIASKIVVTEIFSELKMLSGDLDSLEKNIGPILRVALENANNSVGGYAARRPGAQGMGSTLVAPVIFKNRLYWISVGDSPLYLFRGNRLFRLNEEHSLARRMEKLVRLGEMDAQSAQNHPDRHCLTSVLIGAAIPEIDCRDTPIQMRDGDILIAASDGLQFISDAQIAQITYANRALSGAKIGQKLLKAVRDLDDPDQDNVSICVLKIKEDKKPQFLRYPNNRKMYLEMQGKKKLMMGAMASGRE